MSSFHDGNVTVVPLTRNLFFCYIIIKSVIIREKLFIYPQTTRNGSHCHRISNNDVYIILPYTKE